MKSDERLGMAALNAFRAGNIAETNRICDRIATEHGNRPEWQVIAANIMLNMSAFAKSEAFARCALDSQPGELKAMVTLGWALLAQGRYEDALDTADRALVQHAFRPGPVHVRVRALEGLHRIDEALAFCQARRAAGVDSPDLTESHMMLLERLDRHEEIVEIAGAAVESIKQTNGFRHRSFWAAYARALAKVGRYDEAFEAFRESGRGAPRAFPRDQFIQRAVVTREFFTHDNFQRLPRSTIEDETVIFVVGMPRCGSTLTEQIIHAHPEAFGGGELLFIPELRDANETLRTGWPTSLEGFSSEALTELGSQLLRRYRSLAPSAIRIVDKGLHNIWSLGFLEMLFPRARVILVERDALDNGVSCFTSNLSPIMHPWITRLDTIGLVCRETQAIADFWDENLSMPTLRVKYEDLVRDHEVQTRRIIEFCGLDWDDACLSFHEADRRVITASRHQVSRPIYDSSIGRYKPYEKHLAPLKAALAGEEAPWA